MPILPLWSGMEKFSRIPCFIQEKFAPTHYVLWLDILHFILHNILHFDFVEFPRQPLGPSSATPKAREMYKKMIQTYVHILFLRNSLIHLLRLSSDFITVADKLLLFILCSNSCSNMICRIPILRSCLICFQSTLKIQH